MHTNRKPAETSVTFPHEFNNGQNTLSTFCLKNDQDRRAVLENFKKLNRDLTRAFNRQAGQSDVLKKGTALPEA